MQHKFKRDKTKNKQWNCKKKKKYSFELIFVFLSLIVNVIRKSLMVDLITKRKWRLPCVTYKLKELGSRLKK
jgi:hypothetical protein